MVDAPGQTCNFAQRIYHILFSLLLQLSSLPKSEENNYKL
jgi:hypothetical protein